MSFAVVGADHPNKRGPGRRFELAICAPGETVLLIPEPKNPKDPDAVAVYSCREVQIGYITAERCGIVRRLMAGGATCNAIFQASTSYGGIIRATFDGTFPTLPSPTPSPSRSFGPLPNYNSDEDSGFYPDPDYPDE